MKEPNREHDEAFRRHAEQLAWLGKANGDIGADIIGLPNRSQVIVRYLDRRSIDLEARFGRNNLNVIFQINVFVVFI